MFKIMNEHIAEHEKINNQLQWYLSTQKEVEHNISYFDPLESIYKSIDGFGKTKNIHICNRAVSCSCIPKGKDCICDEDDYQNVDNIKTDLCSNNKFSFEFMFFEDNKIKANKGIRLFSLDNEENEKPILDILYEMRVDESISNNKKYKYWFLRFHDTPNITYPILEGVSISKHSINFCIDYIHYEVEEEISAEAVETDTEDEYEDELMDMMTHEACIAVSKKHSIGMGKTCSMLSILEKKS
jgi:hypothetical protein